MRITVNGKEVETKDELSVSELLVEQSVKMPEMVSVELNGEIVGRGDFESTSLSADDNVEFLYFMVGGSES